MKKITLIGASGFVGSAILQEAINRNIQVTALVRQAAKIKITNPLLKVIENDITKKGVIKEAAKDTDAVISAYNPGWTNPDIYNETLRVYPQILAETKAAKVNRILIVGGAGTLFVSPGVRVMDTDAIPPEIMGGVKSLGEFYLNTLMNETEIDWVFFSPAGTFNPEGTRTGKYKIGKDYLITNNQGVSKISVQDYAKAMIDEFENPNHHKERFTIGY